MTCRPWAGASRQPGQAQWAALFESGPRDRAVVLTRRWKSPALFLPSHALALFAPFCARNHLITLRKSFNINLGAGRCWALLGAAGRCCSSRASLPAGRSPNCLLGQQAMFQPPAASRQAYWAGLYAGLPARESRGRVLGCCTHKKKTKKNCKTMKLNADANTPRDRG